MARRKLKILAQVADYPELIMQDSERFIEIMKNEKREIVLELGMGKGTFINELAKINPDKLYIGIEAKGERCVSSAKKATESGVDNVLIFNGKWEFIKEYFMKNKVNTIWVTFPDPWPKDKHAKHRFINEYNIEEVEALVGDKLYFKSDNKPLYDYTLEVIENSKLKIVDKIDDVHGDKKNYEKYSELAIITEFERRFLDQGINIGFFVAQI